MLTEIKLFRDFEFSTNRGIKFIEVFIYLLIYSTNNEPFQYPGAELATHRPEISSNKG